MSSHSKLMAFTIGAPNGIYDELVWVISGLCCFLHGVDGLLGWWWCILLYLLGGLLLVLDLS